MGLRTAVYRKRYHLLLGAVTIVLMVVVAEVAVRLFDPLGISYYEEAKRYHLDKLADPIVVFKHRPSWRAMYQRVGVSFNELGLRDESVGPKASGEYRILLLGDSVAFGWGVAQDATFAHRVQSTLTSRMRRPVRVINTGVGGYNTVQEARYLQHRGLELAPDMVVLMYVPNDTDVVREEFDPWSSQSLRRKRPAQVAKLLLGRSWAWRLAVHSVRYSAAASADTGGAGFREDLGPALNALRSIKDACASRDTPLSVFYFRWRPFDATRLLEKVEQTLAPVAVHDVAPWFAGRNLREYANSAVDIHPNAQAHAVIAERVADYLAGQIPAGGQ